MIKISDKVIKNCDKPQSWESDAHFRSIWTMSIKPKPSVQSDIKPRHNGDSRRHFSKNRPGSGLSLSVLGEFYMNFWIRPKFLFFLRKLLSTVGSSYQLKVRFLFVVEPSSNGKFYLHYFCILRNYLKYCIKDSL